jgi:hypothetical protein
MVGNRRRIMVRNYNEEHKFFVFIPNIDGWKKAVDLASKFDVNLTFDPTHPTPCMVVCESNDLEAYSECEMAFMSRYTMSGTEICHECEQNGFPSCHHFTFIDRS